MKTYYPNAKQLSRFNRMLADNLGRGPVEHGSPAIYKWEWTAKLLYPARIDYREGRSEGGLYYPEPVYKMVRQYDEDRWCIAMWEAPMSPEEWDVRFGSELAWQPHGLYLITSEVMREGAVPDEGVTEYVIGKIKNHRSKSYRDLLNELNDRVEKREAAKKSHIGDILENCTTTYDSVPGARGGVVSYPSTSKDLGVSPVQQ